MFYFVTVIFHVIYCVTFTLQTTTFEKHPGFIWLWAKVTNDFQPFALKDLENIWENSLIFAQTECKRGLFIGWYQPLNWSARITLSQQMSEQNSPKKEPSTGNMPQPPPYPTPYFQNTTAPQQQFPTVPYNQPSAFKAPPAYSQQKVIDNPSPYYYAPHGPPPPPHYYSQKPYSYQFKVPPPPPNYYANDYRRVTSTKSDPNPSLSTAILVFSILSEVCCILTKLCRFFWYLPYLQA